MMSTQPQADRLALVNEFQRLPGADLIEQGINDVRCGRESHAALLVEIAAPRLSALGIEVPSNPTSQEQPQEQPEHRLYRALSDQADPYSAYNALIARVVSFARAAEHATSG